MLKGIGPSDFVENEGEDGFVKMYGGVLDVYREAFGKVFGRLRDGGPGVLFHCTGLSPLLCIFRYLCLQI